MTKILVCNTQHTQHIFLDWKLPSPLPSEILQKFLQLGGDRFLSWWWFCSGPVQGWTPSARSWLEFELRIKMTWYQDDLWFYIRKQIFLHIRPTDSDSKSKTRLVLIFLLRPFGRSLAASECRFSLLNCRKSSGGTRKYLNCWNIQILNDLFELDSLGKTLPYLIERQIARIEL